MNNDEIIADIIRKAELSLAAVYMANCTALSRDILKLAKQYQPKTLIGYIVPDHDEVFTKYGSTIVSRDTSEVRPIPVYKDTTPNAN